MALLQSELRRIRYELGYNVLNAGAEPYIGVSAVFDQVIATYTQGGATTTSSTSVTAASEATPVTLTLASATGFSAGDTVVIDVDDRQERATVQSVSGANLTVLLQKAHSGTYPVTVEGGESIVREILGHLRDVQTRVNGAASSAGIKSVGQGEVEWFGDSTSTSLVSSLSSLRMYWRDELAAALGVVNLWRVRQAAGSSSVLY